MVIGAGKSSSSLISYLLGFCETNSYKLIVGDLSEELAKSRVKDSNIAEAIRFDINDSEVRSHYIQQSTVVISMLPAFMHPIVAKDCLKYKKHLVTASYISEEIQQMHEDAIKKGILIMGEMGLDPGIDHMSAMKIIDDIKKKGGQIKSFKSFTGGLIAPESDNNPWHYKFSWNPRNVVLAGQGTASYLLNGKKRYIPYQRLFSELESVGLNEVGEFDGYANRDSLHYIEKYNLEGIDTILRGTLRYGGYCQAWNIFVQLGLTDDSFVIDDADRLTYLEFIKSFLPSGVSDIVGYLINNFGATKEIINKIEWLEILSDRRIKLERGTPAQILQHLLEEKWKLEQYDKDMIVMQHQFEYDIEGQRKSHISNLVVKGENQVDTAMAKTVGLPMGILAKLILKRKTNLRGVQIPVMSEVYEPVLSELDGLGVKFFSS